MTRLLNISSLALICCWSSTSNAVDYKVTDIEFASWPKICQARGARYSGYLPPQDKGLPRVSRRESDYVWSVGGWHYCAGLILLRRAELAADSKEVARLAKIAKKEITYSYSRINKRDKWASEMAVSLARAMRLLKDADKAREHLDSAREYHPDYAPIYTALSLLHYDNDDYAGAAKVLQEGVAATKGKSGELQYFLGMAYLKLGKIDEARKQAKIVQKLGYPLRALARNIAKHDAASTAVE